MSKKVFKVAGDACSNFIEIFLDHRTSTIPIIFTIDFIKNILINQCNLLDSTEKLFDNLNETPDQLCVA